MKYAYFSPVEERTYPIALLVPRISKDEIRAAYLDGRQIDPKDVLVLDIHLREGKKSTPVSEIKAYIEEELVPVLQDMQTRYVLCAHGDYFKALAKVSKIEANMGYVLDSPYGDFKVIYLPNYRSIFYDPAKIRGQIDQGMNALIEHISGTYTPPGAGIIKYAAYPSTVEEIESWLAKLLEMDCPLTVDIETFTLKHHSAGIGTISFCWSQGEGIAFAVDYEPIPGAVEAPFGRQVRNEPVRQLLKAFFRQFVQKAIYHSISFDVYVLIYQLFMEDILDTEGLLEGLEIMLANWECTKLITYLATNSCAGNDLKLKNQAQEFSGNWAQDEIKDITRIPLTQLLEYNLIDGLSTWYVLNKHWDTMVADEQLEIYETIFKPATIDIIQMQLTGMPLNMDRVLEVKQVLQAIEDDAVARMIQTKVIQDYTWILRERHVEKRNSELKKKRISLSDDETMAVVFNPNSGPQLQDLLYNEHCLPVIALTDSKEPATDGDTISALRNHTKDQSMVDFLDALIDYKAVNKILTSFIPAFEAAPQGPDGWHYLFGNFNLGGTLSGRLSSSDPNLQNLPSNIFMAITQAILGLYGETLKPFMKKGKLALGKLIKSCFEAPPGWIFAGLDFDSLEDRISALTTKDPNKLKVYTDGYDGHCLRAFSYYGDRMTGIDPNSVESINSIAERYPDERQNSKVPTFLLTYGGTFKGMMQQCGFSEQEAKSIESKYHELYAVSDAWVDAHIEQATVTGYVTAAFGLRVRTPLLKQVIRGTSKTPYEAQAEARSAGNSLGQSWCLLNSRAGSEFMGKVRKSEFRLDIKPTSQIHDAGYFLIRDNLEAVHYTNIHLVKAVKWQDHPAIAHPEVKLGGRLSLFYPNWSKEIEIPNDAEPEVILNIIQKSL